MSPSCASGSEEANLLTQSLPQKEKAREELQEEIRKYLKLLPEVAEPNLARVREIKELLREGRYLTREVIEETASRLALRFLRRE